MGTCKMWLYGEDMNTRIMGIFNQDLRRFGMQDAGYRMQLAFDKESCTRCILYPAPVPVPGIAQTGFIKYLGARNP